MVAALQFSISNFQLAMNLQFSIFNEAQNRHLPFVNASSFAIRESIMTEGGNV